MKQFPLKIITPKGELFHNDIICLSLRGANGDLAIMANHTPLVSTIMPCLCKLQFNDGTQKVLKLDSGILRVSQSLEKGCVLTSPQATFEENKA